MKKILLSSGLIVFALASTVLGSTGAFFSDTETSSGNTFTAGAIDLKIDNTSYYNGVANAGTTWTETDLLDHKFFDFDDLKPGDFGEDTISIHVDTNDAYVCADVTLTSNNDNTQNEAEAQDDPNGLTTGELAQEVNFLWWADDGDNVLETGENVISEGPIGALTLNQPHKVALADSEENIWGGSGPIPGDETVYIGKAWCFGDITPAPDDQDSLGNAKTPAGDNNGNGTSGEPIDGGYLCDGASLDNSTQTDSLTADISFSAVQARHNPEFVCQPDRPPVLQACTEASTQKWADSVVFAKQGLRKNGTPVIPERSNTGSVLGAAQTSGLPSDPTPTAGTFFSLGFATTSPIVATSSIVVSFDNNVIVDEPGADLRIYEVTGGSYPDEFIKVEISQDGLSWVQVAASVARDEDIDFAGALPWAKYVRITDVTPSGPFEATADAYDLDALEALHCGQFVAQN